jgi:hypothetical protein
MATGRLAIIASLYRPFLLLQQHAKGLPINIHPSHLNFVYMTDYCPSHIDFVILRRN